MTRNLLLASMSLVFVACLAGPKQDDPGQPGDSGFASTADATATSMTTSTTVVNGDATNPQTAGCASDGAPCAVDGAPCASDAIIVNCSDASDSTDGDAPDVTSQEAEAGFDTAKSD